MPRGIRLYLNSGAGGEKVFAVNFPWHGSPGNSTLAYIPVVLIEVNVIDFVNCACAVGDLFDERPNGISPNTGSGRNLAVNLDLYRHTFYV